MRWRTVLLVLAILCSLTLTSCGGSKAAAPADEGTSVVRGVLMDGSQPANGWRLTFVPSGDRDATADSIAEMEKDAPLFPSDKVEMDEDGNITISYPELTLTFADGKLPDEVTTAADGGFEFRPDEERLGAAEYWFLHAGPPSSSGGFVRGPDGELLGFESSAVGDGGLDLGNVYVKKD